MRHFIVTFFCTFLSSGNLQAVDNENNYHYQPEPGMVPVVEEHIWPVQTYQTFRGNFYGTARRSINAKPCERHSFSQDVKTREREIMSHEQPTDNQPLPTPTRRSSVSETFKKSLTNTDTANFQPHVLKDGGSNALRIQTQMLKDEESNALESQPQISKEEEPSTFIIKSQIINNEESNTLRSQPQVNNDEGSNTLKEHTQILNDEEFNPVRMQPQGLKDEGSNSVRIKTQIIKKEESTVYKNQPQNLKNEASNALRIKTKILKDEEPNALKIQPQDLNDGTSNTLRIKTQIIKNEESNTYMQPQVFQDEGPDTFRMETKVSQEEDSNTMKTNPEVLNDDGSNTFRIETQILQEEESNTLRAQPQVSKNEGSNTLRIETQVLKDDGSSTFRIQPPDSKDEVSNTFTIKTHVLRNEKPNSLRSSSEVSENFQNPELITRNEIINENYILDNSVGNHISEEDVEVEEPDQPISAPAYEIERVESYSFQGSTDHLESPPLPVNSEPLITQSKVQCSDYKHADALSPQTHRRFLVDKNNERNNELPTFERKGVLRSNSGSQGDAIVFTNNKVLRTSADNQENEVSGQNENISNAKTNVNEDSMGEYENSKLDKFGSSEKSLEKSLQRAGKIQFVLGPKTIQTNKNVMKDPTKGQGISYIKKTTLMLMDYDRVCYACSSANSPVCLLPDRRTGVKYCRKGDNGCVTKTFGSGSTLTLIRDCGRSCEDSELPGLAPNYKSCGICYSDLCNSAYSINIHSLILILPSLVIIVLVKPLL